MYLDQDVQLGSRLDDNNEYKKVKYWASTVGAHDILDTICDTLSTTTYGVDMKHKRKPKIVPAAGNSPDHIVQTQKATKLIDNWCKYVVEEEEDAFVAGVMAGYNNDMFTALCVNHLKACPEGATLDTPKDTPSPKTEL